MAKEIIKQTKQQKVKALYIQMGPELDKALPDNASAERLARYSVMAIADNPRLQECTALSLFRASVGLGLMGLEPNTPAGDCWLVPFRDNKRGITEVQVMIGYKGLLELAYRHPNAREIYTRLVYSNDKVSVRLGTANTLDHDYVLGEDRGEVIAVYAVYKSARGGEDFEIMTVAEVEKIRRESKSGDSPAWKHHKGEMQRKCVLRRLLKRQPKSFEFVLPLSKDDQGSGVIARPQIDSVIRESGLELPEDPIDVEAESTPAPTPEKAPGPTAPAKAATPASESAPTGEPLFGKEDKPAPEPKKKAGRPKKTKAEPQTVAPPPELTNEEKVAAGVKPETAETAETAENPLAQPPLTPTTPAPTPSAADPKIPFVATEVPGYVPEAEELAKLQECPKWVGQVCIKFGLRHDDLQDCIIAQGYLKKGEQIRTAAADFLTQGKAMPEKVAVFVQKFMNPTQDA